MAAAISAASVSSAKCPVSKKRTTAFGMSRLNSSDLRLVQLPIFAAFCPLSQAEDRFRQNVWQSGARNRVPKNG